MNDKSANEHLMEIVGLTHRMVALADEADLQREDDGCGIVFGALRDAGYGIRKLAQKELVKHKERRAPRACRREAACGASVESRRPKVVIAEDEPDIRRFLTAWFEDRGFRTVPARDGMEAVQFAVTERPDLMTLDVSMPLKSGMSVYQDMKGDPSLCGIPVIVITGVGDVFKEFIEARRNIPPPEGFLGKPINLDELSGLVSGLMKTA